MSAEAIVGLYVFILAIFVGFEVISKVPSTLHTPLMSGANAIHGIIVIGAMLVSAAIRLPFTAVFGPDSPFRPRTNVTAAIRYVRGMSEWRSTTAAVRAVVPASA